MSKDIQDDDEKLPVEIDYSEQDDQKDQPTISREVERIISSSNDDQIDDEKDQPNDSPENDAEDDLKNANIEIKKKNNNKKVRQPDNLQYVKFIKEYASSPNTTPTEIAKRIGISSNSGINYICRFSYTVLMLKDDREQIQKVKQILNNLVGTRKDLLFTDNEILALEPKALQYAEYETKKSSESYKEIDFKNRRNNLLKSSTSTTTTDQKRVLSPQEQEAHERFKRYKEQYSKLTNSSRSYIMRFVLENSPWIHYTKIDPFITMFELRENNLMGVESRIPDRISQLRSESVL